MFIGFRVAPTTPRSMRLPQAFFFLNKYTPGSYEHVFYTFCDFSAISGSAGESFQIWLICSNDYASKTLIEILCKKTCCTAPICYLCLICRVIPANLEPSPEYQPENRINKYARSIGFIKYHVHKYPRSS